MITIITVITVITIITMKTIITTITITAIITIVTIITTIIVWCAGYGVWRGWMNDLGCIASFTPQCLTADTLSLGTSGSSNGFQTFDNDRGTFPDLAT